MRWPGEDRLPPPVNDLVSQLKNDPLGTKSIISTATLASKLETRSDSEFLEALEPINLPNTPKVKTVVREDSIKVSAEKLDSVLKYIIGSIHSSDKIGYRSTFID